MKRINVSIDENIDLFFRKFASQKFKFKRGWYSEAVAEAMQMWINQAKSKDKDLSKNNHQLGLNYEISIPQDLLNDMGDLSNAKLIKSTNTDVAKIHDMHIQVVLNAEKIKGVSSIFYSDYIENFNKIIEEGVNVELILTEAVLKKFIESLDLESLEQLKKVISENQLKLWEMKEDNIALTVTDKTMVLGLFTVNGMYDPTRHLVSNHKNTLKWGDRLFEYYLQKAQKVDLEYLKMLSKNYIFDAMKAEFLHA